MQLPALAHIGGNEVVGIAGLDAAKAEATARRWGIQHATCDWRELLDLVPDLVMVTTPVDLHAEMVRASLRSGAAVLCEKPLCASSEDVRKMKAIADASNIVCMPGHNMIHEEGIFRARDMIQRGDLGKIVSCYVMYNIHHSEERALTLP